MAVRVLRRNAEELPENGRNENFDAEISEVSSMGRQLETSVIYNDKVPEGILTAAYQENTRAIVLGHPLSGSVTGFQKVVEAVAGHAPCPAIVVRFSGILHTERILVPVTDLRELEIMHEVLSALSNVGQHRLTLLMLLPGDASEADSLGRTRQRSSSGRSGPTPRPRTRCRSRSSASGCNGTSPLS